MNSSRKTTLFIGVFIIIFGVILLLNNLGLTELRPADFIRTYWPLILIIWGIDFAFQKKNNVTNYIFSIILILFGTLILARNLDYITFELTIFFKLIWPIIFIFLGFSLLRGGFRSQRVNWAVMSGFEKKNKNWTLNNQSYVALMGGIELDLSVADIPEEETTIDLTAIMGGIDIKVPEEMNIVANGISILGGIDFINDDAGGIIASRQFEHHGSESGKKLIIYYRTIMGGIDIRAV